MAQALSCVSSFSHCCDNMPPKVKRGQSTLLEKDGLRAQSTMLVKEWCGRNGGHVLYCVSADRKQEEVNGCAQFNFSLLFCQDSCLGNSTAHSFRVSSHITYPTSNRLLSPYITSLDASQSPRRILVLSSLILALITAIKTTKYQETSSLCTYGRLSLLLWGPW